jgi:hypothetical protein
MRSTWRCSLTVAAALALAVLAAPAHGKRPKAPTGPRYYWEVRGIKVPPGSPPMLKDKAKGLFLAELKKQPAIVLELEPKPASADELEKALRARKLDGFGVVLRVTKSTHELRPPAPGKAFKTLMVEVSVAIDAEKLPSGQLALAGEGNSQVGTEVKAVKEKERLQLMVEALTDAIHQAVEKSVVKLSTPDKPARIRKKKR